MWLSRHFRMLKKPRVSHKAWLYQKQTIRQVEILIKTTRLIIQMRVCVRVRVRVCESHITGVASHCILAERAQQCSLRMCFGIQTATI